MHEIWPNFFLVGAAKAGTTSLYAYLSEHPQVFFPTIKEPHFFTQVRPSSEQRFFIEAITKRSAYLRLFANAQGHSIVGDASPSYLWHPEVPKRIREAAPDARIAMVLRDPLERAYSHYLMDYREGVQHRPFYEAVLEDMTRPNRGWGVSYLYYELGLYADQVRRYFDTFATDRVKLVMFDEFRRDVRGTLREFTTFLGLDPAPLKNVNTAKMHNSYAAPRGPLLRKLAGAKFSRIIGQTIVPRRLGAFIFHRIFIKPAPKPPIDERARELLCSLYEPDLQKLEKLLGRSLPELRGSWKNEPLAEAATG